MDQYGYDSTHESFFNSFKSHLIDFIQTLVVFGAIFALIYLFIAQPHKVSGSSMFPTFHDGDYILTDKVSYKVGEPSRGDVIVLKNPNDESQDFIKRIIGMPGDTIELKQGYIYLDGQRLTEIYLPQETSTAGGRFLTENSLIKVGTNQYFVIGDNRDHSSDSREWGTVPKEKIIGKTFFRYFPPQRFGLFKSIP